MSYHVEFLDQWLPGGDRSGTIHSAIIVTLRFHKNFQDFQHLYKEQNIA